jgi:hypothetical protein
MVRCGQSRSSAGSAIDRTEPRKKSHRIHERSVQNHDMDLISDQVLDMVAQADIPVAAWRDRRG